MQPTIPQNHGGHGSGPAVYELTPAHIAALTGNNSAPGQLLVCLRKRTNGAKQMEWNNGTGLFSQVPLP